MADVKVTDLRQNLPAYLAKVKRGERISVTSRGKIVAELVPPAAPPDIVSAARARLRGSVRSYVRPLDPVFITEEWDMNR